MSGYKKILVAVDLSDESVYVLDKARELGRFYQAELNLCYVAEPAAVGMAVEVSSIDIEGLNEEARNSAREALTKIGADLGIPAERQHCLTGSPAREIRELAKTLGSDLVLMGGHGKRGLELLLGSTSSGVSRGIGCDLLIVRIPDPA
ncbi:MAG: universal stress protein [Pseudomonadales bacterium]|jgi:universal stress protein A|nr:universal stress protein [Pseudomonadales bacterium]